MELGVIKSGIIHSLNNLDDWMKPQKTVPPFLGDLSFFIGYIFEILKVMSFAFSSFSRLPSLFNQIPLLLGLFSRICQNI